ncbi:hypothetical protein D3C87_1625990 [compost metagenome]
MVFYAFNKKHFGFYIISFFGIIKTLKAYGASVNDFNIVFFGNCSSFFEVVKQRSFINWFWTFRIKICQIDVGDSDVAFANDIKRFFFGKCSCSFQKIQSLLPIFLCSRFQFIGQIASVSQSCIQFTFWIFCFISMFKSLLRIFMNLFWRCRRE